VRSPIDPAAIARAIEAVKADPKFSAERTVKAMRWRSSSGGLKAPGWLHWVRDLFYWIDQSARVLVWCAVAVGVGLLIVYLMRVVRTSRGTDASDEWIAPTHVRELDIRPESLPADVGAAARALWDAGDHRGALALLYRGLLSRLAHVHGVPIRDSTTEGDCLALASAHLTAGRGEYPSHVVRVWQRAVYGGHDASTPMFHRVCDQFASMLDRPRDAAAAGDAA